MKRRVLVTGATGQVGSRTIDCLAGEKEVEIVAAVRSAGKAAAFAKRGIATVVLDLDDEGTHRAALEGVDSLFVLTGYTVDMLRQSKALLDNAKKAGWGTWCTWARAGGTTRRWRIGRGTNLWNGISSGQGFRLPICGLRRLCRTC